jgi:hypothetical protein
MSTSTTPVTPISTPKVSWLKRVGSAIYTGLKDVVGFLGSAKVQAAEVQVANVASLLLPAEAPLIQGFQTIMGKVFQQAVVSETAMTTITNSGPNKLAAVVAAIGPELDQWVANNFPGSAQVSAATKAGLVNAIVALQNDITVPASPASTTATAVAAPAASPAPPSVPAVANPNQ